MLKIIVLTFLFASPLVAQQTAVTQHPVGLNINTTIAFGVSIGKSFHASGAIFDFKFDPPSKTVFEVAWLDGKGSKETIAKCGNRYVNCQISSGYSISDVMRVAFGLPPLPLPEVSKVDAKIEGSL